MRNLLFGFPVHVIAELLGLPEEHLPEFHRLAVQVIGVTVDMDRATVASAALREMLAPILAERRAEPREDMISLLATAEHDGQRLTDEEIYSFCRLLLPAGAETTYRSSSNLLYGLLTRPDQLDAVRDDRSLLSAAIEEGIRWEPPLLRHHPRRHPRHRAGRYADRQGLDRRVQPRIGQPGREPLVRRRHVRRLP